MLIEMDLKEFNATLGSDAPAPGGGSVAALSGSLGAELVSMVCNLSFGRENLAAHQSELAAAQAEAAELGRELLLRVDADTDAFTLVMDAFRMPKGTDEEKAARAAAIQVGYKEAVEAPLTTARQCLAVLRLGASLQGAFNANAMSDFGVAALMAHAGLEGAVMNVRINTPVIKDQDFVNAVEAEVARMMDEGTSLKEEIYRYVYENLS